MATLVIENVPDETLEALKIRAELRGTTMEAEVLDLVSSVLPLTAAREPRLSFLEFSGMMTSRKYEGSAPYQSSEEMLREMREEN